jgi:Divergent InlB B-repeat domain
MRSSAVVASIAVALLFLVPAGSIGAPPGSTHQPSGQPLIAEANLTIGSTPVANLSSMFWGSTISTRARILSEEANLINSTGVRTMVFPGGNSGDRYNPFNNSELGITRTRIHGKAMWYNGWTTVGTSESQFISLCRSIKCTAILQVPGEIDNPAFAARIVNYTVNTLGFSPAYWEIGNEPGLWKNWGQSWGNWTPDGPTITPEEYAEEVGKYTAAMRSVDSNIRIIGIAGTGAPNGEWPLTTWIADLLYDDGPEINAISYHEYPAGHTSNASLLEFYGALHTNSSVPFHVDQLRDEVTNLTALENYTAVCPNVTSGPVCGPIPVFATEIGSGLSNKWTGAYARSFPGGVSLAAQITQAMALNLSNVDLFGTELGVANSWFNTSGQARPDYTIYSEFLAHLGSEVFPVNFSLPSEYYASNTTSLAYNLYGIATIDREDGDRSDLLLVNDNLTTNVSLSPYLPGIPSGSPTELWTWSGTLEYNGTNFSLPYVAEDTPAPVAEFFPNGIPAGWTLPPETVALFESYPVPSAPVTFTETGLSSGTTWWFVDVGGFDATSIVSNLTLLLPDGEYEATTPQVSTAMYLESGANEWERISGPATIPVSITGRPTSVTIPFETQWRVDIDATPTIGGSTSSNGVWATEGEPFDLTATPAPGWFFDRWFGWGNGSISNTTRSEISVVPTGGHINENATFVRGYNVTFYETGLPLGLNWSVSLTGHLTSNTTKKTTAQQVLTFDAANGTWGYNITPPPDYTALPPAGSVNISGGPVSVTIAFGPGRPPPPTYPVELTEKGLPNGTDWSISVRAGSPYPSNGQSSILLYEPNGTYGFTVGYVPGYHPNPLRDAFYVNGTNVSAPLIVYLENHTTGPTLYPVVWKETGLGTDPAWSVDVNGTGTIDSNGSWVSTRLPNGTYSYFIPETDSAIPESDEGAVFVNGSGATIDVVFQIGHSSVVSQPTGIGNDLTGLVIAGAIFGGIIIVGAIATLVSRISLRRKGCADPGNHHLHAPPARCAKKP